jgi:TusA-related sulfurtransferase
MAVVQLDLRGKKCPQPTLKMTIQMHEMSRGDVLEVMADCPSFEADLKGWIKRTHKTLVWFRDEPEYKHCQIII